MPGSTKFAASKAN
ncbi:hypothetical protein CP082626L3_0893A, partial [Chlamydia psittaci 08-2626_L3]